MQSLFTSINIFTYFWTLNYYRFEFILESRKSRVRDVRNGDPVEQLVTIELSKLAQNFIFWLQYSRHTNFKHKLEKYAENFIILSNLF